MNTSPVRPGACLWAVVLFAWPALFEACGAGAVSMSEVLPVLTDAPAAGPPPVLPMAPIRPFDEGFVVSVD